MTRACGMSHIAAAMHRGQIFLCRVPVDPVYAAQVSGKSSNRSGAGFLPDMPASRTT
jgi:hypothetical protein